MDKIDKTVEKLEPVFIKLRDSLIESALNSKKDIKLIAELDFGDLILNELGGNELAEATALSGINAIGATTADEIAMARADIGWYKENLRGLGNEVKQSLIDSILEKQSPAELKKALYAAAEKKMASYQIDALMNTVLRTYDRRVFAIQTADDDPEQRYLYTGPLDSKTRDSCRAYLENQPDEGLTRAEIDSNSFGVDFVAGGGFNCRHRFYKASAEAKELIIEG